jgi:radical SAM protein with 4Fe4S-binding SPASM domain
VSHGPLLESLSLQLTTRCNLACSFCKVDANAVNVRGRLPMARIERTLDEAVGLGLKRLRLTGGEPSLSPYLDGVVRHASRLGVRCSLITNGTLLDRGRLEELYGLGLRDIQVGVDGLASSHDSMRGRPRSWKAAMACLGHAVELGYRTRVSAVAFRSNIHELPQLMVLAAQRELDSFELVLGAPMGRGKAWSDRLLGRRAWQAFLAELRDGVRRGDFGANMAIHAEQGWVGSGERPAAHATGRTDGCRSLDSRFHDPLIRADGVVFPCVMLLHSGQDLGDLTRSSLSELLQRAIEIKPNASLSELPGGCEGCPNDLSCGGGCRGYALALRGGAGERDPRCPGPQPPWPRCPSVRIDLRA